MTTEEMKEELESEGYFVSDDIHEIVEHVEGEGYLVFDDDSEAKEYSLTYDNAYDFIINQGSKIIEMPKTLGELEDFKKKRIGDIEC